MKYEPEWAKGREDAPDMRQTDRQMVGWIYERIDGRMSDGWTDRLTTIGCSK